MPNSYARALLVIFCSIWFTIPLSYAQTNTDDKTRGIQLYQQGDAAGAVIALKDATKRNKNDIEAWHFLGLALEKQGKPKDALKAHEKAAKLGEDLLSAKLGTLTPDFAAALQEIRPLIDQAIISAERYLALSNKPSQKKSDEWRGRANFLRDFSSQSARTTGQVYTAKEVTTKVVILSKPEASYTVEARRNGTTGIVQLRILLAADGKVRAIGVAKGLPNGLTRQAIEAARRIKFQPATKDGVPVSQWVQIQYEFHLY